MKKISFLLLFAGMISQAYSQVNNFDLPPEFKDVAVQAFQKISPATKQWFITTANQHPAGPFDTAWANRKLRERFGVGLGGADPCIELLAVMLEYQRMMNKEEREDKKMQNDSKQFELTSKEDKLKMDKAKIDQQKKEADEKANNAMTAAQTDLWIGIVNGNSAIAGSGSQKSNSKISNIRLSPSITQKIDSPKTKTKNSDLMQKAIDKQEKKDAKGDEAKNGSEDHKRATRDAVQKLLDQIGEMQRSAKF